MTEHASNNDRVRVLVIDDSEIALELVLDLLASHDIAAIGLPGPIGATSTVMRNDIRVVVTDVNMPELRGNSLVSLFRNNPRTQRVKVILLSDLPANQLHELVMKSGAVGGVEKKHIEEKLVPLVRRTLNERIPTGAMQKREAGGA